MGMILVDYDATAEVPLAVDASSHDTHSPSTEHSLSQSGLTKSSHSVSHSQGCGLASLLQDTTSQSQSYPALSEVAYSDESEMDVEQDCYGDLNTPIDSPTKESNKLEQPGSPTSVLDMVDWDGVHGLESIQLAALKAVATRGVCWSHPNSEAQTFFTLHYGGEVDADGNCLFTAVHRLLGCASGEARNIRESLVRRFLKDYQSGILPRDQTDQSIKNLYSPDLQSGWGVHVVQEVKLLAKKNDRAAMDTAIEELMACGMTRDAAAESVFKERCTRVANGTSWAHFMRVSGSDDDEHDIITLQYTEEGLLSVDENREGRAAAFGDDIAIESLATEFAREIFVMQAHGEDGMVDADSCLFFLPHRPRGETAPAHPPMFLFMKGTGWCGSGADHYEPVITRPRSASFGAERPAISL